MVAHVSSSPARGKVSKPRRTVGINKPPYLSLRRRPPSQTLEQEIVALATVGRRVSKEPGCAQLNSLHGFAQHIHQMWWSNALLPSPSDVPINGGGPDRKSVV